MATNLQMSPISETPKQQESAPADAFVLPASAYLARLAALHDEAAETAHLANLLGRAPWAAATLLLATLATAFFFASSANETTLVAWGSLSVAASAAIARVYGKAIKAPFDRIALRAFARDLAAILLYAGAAWASGLLLVLPWNIGSTASIAFVSFLPAVLATILRARDIALCFLGSASAMGVFCVLMRGTDLQAILGVMAAGAVIAIAARLSDRTRAPELRLLAG